MWGSWIERLSSFWFVKLHNQSWSRIQMSTLESTHLIRWSMELMICYSSFKIGFSILQTRSWVLPKPSKSSHSSIWEDMKWEWTGEWLLRSWIKAVSLEWNSFKSNHTTSMQEHSSNTRSQWVDKLEWSWDRSSVWLWNLLRSQDPQKRLFSFCWDRVSNHQGSIESQMDWLWFWETEECKDLKCFQPMSLFKEAAAYESWWSRWVQELQAKRFVKPRESCLMIESKTK